MTRFTQSIHLDPDTDEGQRILAILLSVPRYQRGALLRAVLQEHLEGAARTRWPALTPKSAEEIRVLLAERRPGKRLTRPATAAPPIHEAPASSGRALELERPGLAEDVEARLDRLDFSSFTSSRSPQR